MELSRRQILKSAAALSAVKLIPEQALSSQAFSNLAAGDPSPLQRLDDNSFWSEDFNGDAIGRPHDILWNIDGYLEKKGGIPKAKEHRPLIVVGGGAAGLCSAYLNRSLSPLVLEQAPTFGGNTQGEKLGNSFYSIGAAYFTKPSPESRLGQLLTELGLNQFYREEPHTSVLLKSQLVKNFWQGDSDPQRAQEFKNFFAYLNNLSELDEKLDRISFIDWLHQEFPNIHPHIQEYVELYCWSSFGASSEELSAYQVLGFLNAETQGLIAFPGGNSLVTQRLYEVLKKDLPKNSLRAGAFVLSIEVKADRVPVVYEDHLGKIQHVTADKLIFAAPKFVGARVIRGLSEKRIDAMRAIPYRAYIVGNLFVRRQKASPSFELYCLKGEIPEVPTSRNRLARGFTDICFGSWALSDNDDQQVLTLYHALPYEGARQFLFNPMTHEKYKNQLLDEAKNIFKGLGMSPEDIIGLRLTRWGHSLPIAQTGLLTNGTLDLARETINNKVFFANQDCYANPCFESALARSHIVTKDLQNS